MRILVLDLAKRAGFPYKPAAIKPGKCLTAPWEPCSTGGPLVSAADAMMAE